MRERELKAAVDQSRDVTKHLDEQWILRPLPKEPLMVTTHLSSRWKLRPGTHEAPPTDLEEQAPPPPTDLEQQKPQPPQETKEEEETGTVKGHVLRALASVLSVISVKSAASAAKSSAKAPTQDRKPPDIKWRPSRPGMVVRI